jgi:hypothetical protein
MTEVKLNPGDRVRVKGHPDSIGTVVLVRDNGTAKVNFGKTSTNWNIADLELVNV